MRNDRFSIDRHKHSDAVLGSVVQNVRAQVEQQQKSDGDTSKRNTNVRKTNRTASKQRKRRKRKQTECIEESKESPCIEEEIESELSFGNKAQSPLNRAV